MVPLVGLAATFHYTNWLPPGMSEGKWAADGMEMFGRWFRRRGWFGGGETTAVVESSPQGAARFNLDGDNGRAKVAAVPPVAAADAAPVRTKREKWWGRSEVGVRVIVEWVSFFLKFPVACDFAVLRITDMMVLLTIWLFLSLIFRTATGWAIVKALLPLRLVLSAWGTPWFARAVVIPCSGWFRRKMPFISSKKG